MSSEVHKYIEKALEKNQNLFDAEVINFPSENKNNKSEILEKNVVSNWEINDKSNQDQLRAIIGICFMLTSLVIIGLFSNFL